MTSKRMEETNVIGRWDLAERSFVLTSEGGFYQRETKGVDRSWHEIAGGFNRWTVARCEKYVEAVK